MAISWLSEEGKRWVGRSWFGEIQVVIHQKMDVIKKAMWGGTYTLYNLVRKRAYNILKYILESICYEQKL